ncbi:DNA polymerase III subunit alpha [Chloroflexota bacterium]
MFDSGYVELHCHSFFSLLDGASSPEALAAQAAALGYPALALTDRSGLYGAIRFWQAAKEYGLKPLIGAEIALAASGHLTLLAETQHGYASLCRLLSAGHLAGQKGHPTFTLESVAQHAEGLVCLSGCRQGLVSRALLEDDEDKALRLAGRLRDIFGVEGFWIELQRHYLPTDALLVPGLVSLARRLGAGFLATNDVHYSERSGQHLHDVLSCIRQHTTLPEALAGGLLHSNSERHLKAPQEMADLFCDLPDALVNTLHIAERCDVRLDFSEQRLPTFDVPEGYTLGSYLRHLCELGLSRKFDPVTPQARSQLEHELAVIERAKLFGYFLVVWDIVRFARSQGIRCQGRGSAANSLVAYLLDITPVDPLRHNLLFERFLSEGTKTMPDIDVDFAADRREEVIQYVYERYGEEHVAMVCNLVTYRARSAVREVAKTLAFPPDVIDRVAKELDSRSAEAAAEMIEGDLPSVELPGAGALPWRLLIDLLQQMGGIPRHLSIHVGGMLITASPLVEVVPLERATMPGRVVVQWDKDSVEDAGLIKIDLLSLRTLGAVEEALAHIRAQRQVTLDLDRLPLDDPAVYDMLQKADTVGCFQVESRAQAQMQPKMKPTCFEDIIVEIALIRPGPIQGGMVHPYLRRRQGLEPVCFIHPLLEPVLAESMGVIVFQEQVIRVAMVIAGFSPVEADRLRRAMSRSRSDAAMTAIRERFLIGALANGIEEATAVEIFRQLAGFAGFGFCKSHAAAFALVAYQTLYLKVYFPAEFFCGLLNHQPLGFYPPSVLIGDARRHGVSVLRPDINHSLEACTLEGAGPSTFLRLGLRYVHGLGETWQMRIVERRRDQPFQSLLGFCRRTRIPRPVVENLIRAGAMDGLGRARRDLLWELGGLVYQEEGLDLQVPVEAVALPSLDQVERLAWEYELLGVAPGTHVMDLYRESLEVQGVLSSRQLEGQPDGRVVRVAGLAVVRQRPPTAKGFLFITLEDEQGLANLIVRPGVYDRYRDVLRNAPLLQVKGRLQREGDALSVLVYEAAALGRATAIQTDPLKELARGYPNWRQR